MEVENNMKDKITYSKCVDYYIPDLAVPDTNEYIIGKYGRLRRQFLKEHHKSFYTALMIEGKLPEYLAEIDETCHNVLKDMVSKMAKQEAVTEQLKADNQMLWVQKMNSIHSRAEEVILREYVYGGFAE